MANFCTKCGKPLVDGQSCDCGMEEEISKNFFRMVLEIIKAPADGLLEAVEDEKSKNGLILMGIEALLAGLYLYIMAQKLIATAVSGVSGLLGTSSIGTQMPDVTGLLLNGILITAVSSLITSGLVMGLMKGMAKEDINWFQSCQITGLRSLGCSMGWILGILGIFLGLYSFSLIVIVIGSVLGYLYFIVGICAYADTNKNMIPYILLIIMVVSTLVSYFILKEIVFSSLLNGASSLQSLENIF